MESVGLFLLLGLIVLCTFSLGGGSRDRRFKTGRKGNVLPTHVPLRIRLMIAFALWAAGFLIAFPREGAYIVAVGFLVPLTWIVFPFFVSPFTKYRNSAVQLVAGRMIACVIFGLYAPYLAVKPFQSTPLATSAANSQSRANAQRVVEQQPEVVRKQSQSSTAAAPSPVVEQPSSISLAPVEIGQPTPSAVTSQTSQLVASAAQPIPVRPSFDCQLAASSVEKIICSSPTLARLDSELAAAFAVALQRTQNSTLARQSQRDWLRQQRDFCDSPSCLENVYLSRIASLNAQ